MHKYEQWAVVVAQLVEQSLPKPEVRSSNPVILEFFIDLFTINCIEKTKKKKKICCCCCCCLLHVSKATKLK